MLLLVLQMMQGNHHEDSNVQLLDSKMSVDTDEVCSKSLTRHYVTLFVFLPWETTHCLC